MSMIKNTTPIVMATLLAAPLFAGDDDYEKKKCSADAEECITTMVKKLSERGWIGIEWDDESEETVLTHIVANSPAEAAGLQKGDTLRVFNGVPMSAGEEAVWTEAKKSLVPDKTITLTVERNGVAKKFEVKLVPLPRHVMAQWIGNHVIEHHVIADKDKDEEAEAPRP
ncbi:MAG: PDZ domain-containing protein [Thermoanaerobaculia bacterium]